MICPLLSFALSVTDLLQRIRKSAEEASAVLRPDGRLCAQERGCRMKARLVRLIVAAVSLVALVAALGAGWKWG